MEDLSYDNERILRAHINDQIMENFNGKVVRVEKQEKKSKQVPKKSNSDLKKAIAMSVLGTILVCGTLSVASLVKTHNELNDYREKRGRDEVSFTDDLFDAPAYVKVTVDGKNYYFDNENEKFIMEDGYILDAYENLLPSTDENKGDFYLDNINTFYKFMDDDEIASKTGSSLLDYIYQNRSNVKGE